MAKKIKAWHFIAKDRRLGNGDGRKIRKGQTLKVDCEPVLCEAGLHGSKRPIDALTYAPGPIICRVEIGGHIIHGDDKLVGNERTVIWWADATVTLHEFACWYAERALKTAKVTDERCWNAIRVKRKWLKGEAAYADLVTSHAAAWDASRDALSSAARSASMVASFAAARSAVIAALWAASWSESRSVLNRRLAAMLKKLGGVDA